MIPHEHYQQRRREFLERLEAPVLLMAGGPRSRDYPDNLIPFRADANFLFFFPDPEPNSAAFFDPADGSVSLFLPERNEVNALWEGPLPSFRELQDALGVTRILPFDKIEDEVPRLAGARKILSVGVADSRATALAQRLTGLPLDFHDTTRIAPDSMQLLLSDLRHRKSPEEADELRHAARITIASFREAMAVCRPGVTELEVWAALEHGFARRGATPGFLSIVTVRGETLHNHSHAGTLADGDLVLVDAGAEVPSGYGADVTRAWPANGRFSPEQRDVYEIVLAALKAGTEATGPGVRYRDIHTAASRVIAQGLVDLGLLNGSPDSLVEQGVHALFFPHGVGHLLGLDTHDLEAFGDRILYGPGRSRSSQFGTAFLRIDLDLTAGMVVTVEPGLYFVPGILHLAEFRSKFRSSVNFDEAERWLAMNDGRGFGGIRLEDDILVTEDGRDNLTADLPREIADVENLVGTAEAARSPSP